MINNKIINYQNLQEEKIKNLHNKFKKSNPFPYIVIDNFFEKKICQPNNRLIPHKFSLDKLFLCK